MKKIFVFLCLCFSLLSQAQISTTVNVSTAGNLGRLLTANEKSNTTNLTITGKIDARDFVILRDSMPKLAVIDISKVAIVAYMGTNGTSYYNSTYPANTIPESAFYVYSEQLSETIALTSIILPSSVTALGDFSFALCRNLTSLNISSAITSIGNAAFSGSGAFFYVDASNQKYSSNNGVLFNKKQNLLIQIPTSFANSYTVPSTVDSIGAFSFLLCDKLNSVNIPASVTSIGDGAFYFCNASIFVDEMNMSYSVLDGVLYNKSQTQLITCPASKSGDFIIPNTVSEISNNGLLNCKKITSITLPSTIKTIGNYAFGSCTGLTAINTNSQPISLSNNYYVFDSVPLATCVLNVPYGTKSLYQAANQWMNFTNIAETGVGFIINKNAVTLQSKEGSTSTVKISSNTVWSAASDQYWLKVIPVYGSSDSIITFIAEANSVSDTRTAKVTISANGVNPQIITVTQAGLPKTVNITAGGLSTTLSTTELNSTYDLTITGTMDARDFKTIRDNMPQLISLDLSAVSIGAYTGSAGTSYNTTYLANAIPENAFNNQNYSTGNLNLTYVILPLTITEIGNNSFSNCKAISNLTIPYSVNKIGTQPFYNCISLISFQVYNSIPIDISSSWGVFSGINSSCVLKVPYGAKSLYTAASQWKDFSSIFECPYNLKVDTKEVKFSSNESNRTVVKVTTDKTWKVNCNSTWLNVLPETGLNNDSLVIIANPNTTFIARRAIITLTIDNYEMQKIIVTQSGLPTTVNVNAGEFDKILTENQLNSIEGLILTGTLDARDFKTMRDKMPNLATLDLSKVSISEYTGTEGPYFTNTYTYPANEIPKYSFCRVYIEYSQYFVYTGKSTLKMIKFPESIESIGNYAFFKCSGLVGDLNIGNNVLYIKNNAFGYCNFSSVRFGASVTKIDDYAFYACRNLAGTIRFMNKIDTIGSYAFCGCNNISEIHIGSNVKKLGSSAFSWCSKLMVIYAYSSKPIELDYWEVFSQVSNNCIVYVPFGAKSSYQYGNWWSYQFRNFVEMSNTDVTNPQLDEVIVYPNPSTAYFSVTGLEDVATVTVFDLNGKVLFSKQVSNSEAVSVEDLSKGFYIVRIRTKGGFLERKLIKN